MPLPYAATWDLAFLCNYRCPYCFLEWSEPALGHLHDGVTAGDWNAFWDRVADRYGQFHIHIAGGEPFSYPGFPELARRVAARHVLSVNTNLSWDLATIDGKIAPARLQITASFHPHYADAAAFLKKLQSFRDAGYRAAVTTVAYPPFFEKLAAWRDLFRGAGIDFVTQPFQGGHGGKAYPKDYTAEERKFLYGESKFMPGEGMAHALRDKSPLGRPCAAGQRRFRAVANGKIFRCVPSVKLRETEIGHIKDPALELFDAPKPCPAAVCYCPEEIAYLVEPASQ
jgi:MoaA/NifB/PqqE/SkfB family radical SAM enzyme